MFNLYVDLIIYSMALKSPDEELSLEIVLYCIVLGSVMLVFSDVQSYEKACYCYSLCPCPNVYTICGQQLKKEIILKNGRNFHPKNKRLAPIRRPPRLVVSNML